MNCLICGEPLPAGSRRDRTTCGDRCRQRKRRRRLPVLTPQEAMAALEAQYPERWAEPPPRVITASAADPLDGLLGELRRAESDLLDRLRELAV